MAGGASVLTAADRCRDQPQSSAVVRLARGQAVKLADDNGAPESGDLLIFVVQAPRRARVGRLADPMPAPAASWHGAAG